jgi:hypothetical protein
MIHSLMISGLLTFSIPIEENVEIQVYTHCNHEIRVCLRWWGTF